MSNETEKEKQDMTTETALAIIFAGIEMAEKGLPYLMGAPAPTIEELEAKLKAFKEIKLTEANTGKYDPTVVENIKTQITNTVDDLLGKIGL